MIYVEDVDQVELVSTRHGYLSRDKYQQRVLAGFTVLVSPEVLKHRSDSALAIRFVETQLKELNKSLPKDKLDLLHEVRIWIEWEVDKKAAAFHSSAAWLKRNGRSPEKAESVEISNIQNYVKWNREKQVSGMLHEMSHAFHNLCLGDDHAGILAAYQAAMQRKLYDSVPAVEGGLRPAYAMNNEKEYFAEMTEAYFGRNDFYPFNREQLKEARSDGLPIA